MTLTRMLSCGVRCLLVRCSLFLPVGRAQKRSKLGKQVDEFAAEESGSFVVFSLFIFLAMLMLGGMAVDFMRYENVRVHLQNTVDRSVLAAADMEQDLDPEQVVSSYFQTSGLLPFLDRVNVRDDLVERRVTAVASADVPTMFMRLLGIKEHEAIAAGTAAEGRSNIEVSMVLDISYSMSWDTSGSGSKTKMETLHEAAGEFLDTVLDPNAEDLISVSLIPYSAQVNIGPEIFTELNTDHRHNFSHCVEFENADFSTTSLNQARTYEQTQHFEWSTWYHADEEINHPGCPQETFERMIVHSQDVDTLKGIVESYEPRANTAIHIGMKWGTALLDPSFRNITQTLYSTYGTVENVFRDRPADFDDEETEKFIILMTDGENVDTYSIQDWAYDSTSEIIFWARYPLWYYLYGEFGSAEIWNEFYETKYTASDANTQLKAVCQAAKDAEITVYTVGFEVSNASARLMRTCASTPSHFFRVAGEEMTSAFNAIARDIVELKLVQ